MTAIAHKRRVLLVDDDPEFTSMLRDFLLAHGEDLWDVEMAAHYTTALAAVKKSSFDLVVLDLYMPVMDGLQFLALIKRGHPHLPVVILTGYATEENRAYALKNGAALFLDKASVAGGFEAIYAGLEAVASSAPAGEGFQGMLRQVGLPDVLQMECLGRKSSILEINAGRVRGRIFICDGSIQHADAPPLQGEPALFQLLGLKGGEFHLKPFVKPPRQTIDGQWESLLMEAARLRDEADERAASGLADPLPQESEDVDTTLPDLPMEEPAVAEPPVDEPAVAELPPEVFTEAAIAVEGDDWRIQEILICSTTGEILYEWQAEGIDRRVRLLKQLAAQGDWLGESFPLGRADRLEIGGVGERTIALLHPDHRVLVRSIATSAGMP